MQSSVTFHPEKDNMIVSIFQDGQEETVFTLSWPFTESTTQEEVSKAIQITKKTYDDKVAAEAADAARLAALQSNASSLTSIFGEKQDI